MRQVRSGIRPRVRSRRQLIAIEQRSWAWWRWTLIVTGILILMMLAYAAGRHDAWLGDERRGTAPGESVGRGRK